MAREDDKEQVRGPPPLLRHMDQFRLEQQIRERLDRIRKQMPHPNDKPPIDVLPPARGNMIADASPGGWKKAAMALGFANAWAGEGGRVVKELGMAPYRAAKNILGGAPIESITGQDVMALGSVMTPGYGRAAAGSIGAAGGKLTVPRHAVESYRRYLARRKDLVGKIEELELLKPQVSALKDSKRLKEHQDIIDEMWRVIKEHDAQVKPLADEIEKVAGKNWWELGSAGGKRPPRPPKIRALIEPLRGDPEFERLAMIWHDQLARERHKLINPDSHHEAIELSRGREMGPILTLLSTLSDQELIPISERIAAWHVYKKRFGHTNFEIQGAGLPIRTNDRSQRRLSVEQFYGP